MTNSKVRPDVRQLPSGAWQARVRTTEGTRKTVGTYPTQDAATVAWWEARAKVQAGTWADPSKGNVRFSDWAEEFLELSNKNLGAGTLRNYKTIIRKHLIPAFGTKPVNKISRQDVRRWWSKMPATQNSRNVYFCFRSVMREAVELGLIENNPVQAPKAGKDMSTPRPEHSLEEFKTVLGHVPHIYQVAAWTLFSAHLRVSELAGLNRGDFDPKTGQLTVERQDSEIGGRHLKDTKTGQRRSLAVLEPGASMLAKYYKSRLGAADSPMFHGPKGGRITARQFRIQWDKACVLAEIENFHVHDVRHIGLTLVARSGATNADIKLRGGHASDSAAARYQHSGTVRDQEIAGRVSFLLGARAQ